MNFSLLAGIVTGVIILVALRWWNRRPVDHGSVPMNADRVDRFNKMQRHD
jgi:hypothetical protein